MAIYHFSVQVIGRSDGRSAVAAAAYRSGERLISQYDGTVSDYTHKKWVEYKEILLPQNSPPEYADRQILWNAVEKIEKGTKAQLCREFEIALPNELSLQQRINIAHIFAKSLTDSGMCADVCLHNPPLHNDLGQFLDADGNLLSTHGKPVKNVNCHMHILVTMRPLDEAGEWQPKMSKVYICSRGEERAEYTAEEFAAAQRDGWEKLYQFVRGGKKIWLTQKEGEKEGLQKANANAKIVPYGRPNPIYQKWNSMQQLMDWRRQWQDICNEALKNAGIADQVDCRSNIERKIETVPEIHLGPASTAIMRREERLGQERKMEENEKSDREEINKIVRHNNSMIRTMRNALDILCVNIGKKMENIKEMLIEYQYQNTILSDAARQEQYAVDILAEKIRRINKTYCENVVTESDALQLYGYHNMSEFQADAYSLDDKMKQKNDLEKEIIENNDKSDKLLQDYREYSALVATDKKNEQRTEEKLSSILMDRQIKQYDRRLIESVRRMIEKKLDAISNGDRRGSCNHKK